MLDTILIPKAYSLQAVFNLDPNEVDPTIEVEGYAIPDPASFTDPQAAQYAEFLRGAIPPVDRDYEFRRELIADVAYWWTSTERDVLTLWGPTGAGKTSLFEQWCARLGVPMFSGKGHRSFEQHEAFGHYVAGANGETVFAPGPVTLAAQYGLPVIINEYDRIQPSRAIVFNDVFEGRAFPLPSKHGEMVQPAQGFRAVITANTNLVEDPSGNYTTASSHDISLLERLYSVAVGYPSPDAEKRLLERILKPFEDDLLTYWFDQEDFKINTAAGQKVGAAITRQDYIDAMVELANKIRAQSKDGGNTSDAALERTMSTRILRKIAFHAIQHASAPEKLGKSGLHIAVRKYLSNMATESTRMALHQAVEVVFGVGPEVAK